METVIDMFRKLGLRQVLVTQNGWEVLHGLCRHFQCSTLFIGWQERHRACTYRTPAVPISLHWANLPCLE